MKSFNYPLILMPVSVPRPWGGGRLCKLYDRECGESEIPIGEAWDVSTWPKDPGNPNLATVTKITNGPLAGTMLDEVVDVPVVVKLLDSAEKLSVQVHPVLENEHKDEMWYILHADPDAYLFCGLKAGIDKAEFCNLIKSPTPDQEKILSALFMADNIKPGMFYNVPTGTVHAVGPGLVSFEISEKTQVTYRLYDYNRKRALHLEDGEKAVMATRPNQKNLDPEFELEGYDSLEVLTEFPTFCVLKAVGEDIVVRSAGHMHLVTATMGDIYITGPDNDWNITLKHSYTCLMPRTDDPYIINTSAGKEVLISPLCD